MTRAVLMFHIARPGCTIVVRLDFHSFHSSIPHFSMRLGAKSGPVWRLAGAHDGVPRGFIIKSYLNQIS